HDYSNNWYRHYLKEYDRFIFGSYYYGSHRFEEVSVSSRNMNIAESLEGQTAGLKSRAAPPIVENAKGSDDLFIHADSIGNTFKPAAPQEGIQVRTNFNETAFFFPHLRTDADGNIEFS